MLKSNASAENWIIVSPVVFPSSLYYIVIIKRCVGAFMPTSFIFTACSLSCTINEDLAAVPGFLRNIIYLIDSSTFFSEAWYSITLVFLCSSFLTNFHPANLTFSGTYEIRLGIVGISFWCKFSGWGWDFRHCTFFRRLEFCYSNRYFSLFCSGLQVLPLRAHFVFERGIYRHIFHQYFLCYSLVNFVWR